MQNSYAHAYTLTPWFDVKIHPFLKIHFLINLYQPKNHSIYQFFGEFLMQSRKKLVAIALIVFSVIVVTLVVSTLFFDSSQVQSLGENQTKNLI